MFNSCNAQEKQDIILPDGYKGWFAIVYDCSCGKEKEIQGERIQQIIPSNGILLVKYPRNSGELDVRFYYQKNDGKKLITTISKGTDTISDSLKLSSQFSRYSFNGQSKCAPEINDFYEHETVLYSITDKETIVNERSLDVFKEKLEEFLKKK